MNTYTRFLTPLMVGATCLFLVACSSNDSVVDTAAPKVSQTSGGDLRSQLAAKVGPEQADAILTPKSVHSKSTGSVQAAVTYEAEICNGSYSGTSTRGSINDATAWKYYKFFGTAGDKVTITVNRTGCGIDPAFSLYAGVTTISEGLAVGGGNSEMEWLTWNDDAIAPLIECGCNGDPSIPDYEITETGWYSITVFDFNGCGDDLSYELEVSGLTCAVDNGGATDTDGDGVADDVDPFPTSDSQATIVIDGNDTKVDNAYLDNGTYMMDKIMYAHLNSGKHYKFVLWTTLLSSKWKKSHLITSKQRNKIIYGAWKSSW